MKANGIIGRKGWTGLTGLVALALAGLAGCYEIELEVPVVTQVTTVEGNPILNQANAILHGQILEPRKVERNFGIGGRPVGAVRLVDFQVRVTPDSVDGPDDHDDLRFVKEMVVLIRSLDPNAGLKEIAIAWYYADEADNLDPDVMVFETDDEVDLTPYIRTGFELSSRSISVVPGDDVSVEGTATFVVTPGS